MTAPIVIVIVIVNRLHGQELEFDLSMLAPEEKSAINHRKALERCCRYPVEELHARVRLVLASVR